MITLDEYDCDAAVVGQTFISPDLALSFFLPCSPLYHLSNSNNVK